MHKKYIHAFQKTLEAYDALIQDPENNIHKWKKYGEAGSCLFCRISDSLNDFDCRTCPLDSCTPGFFDLSTYVHSFAANMSSGHIRKNLIKYAKARRKWILKRLDAQGYEYK